MHDQPFWCPRKHVFWLDVDVGAAEEAGSHECPEHPGQEGKPLSELYAWTVSAPEFETVEIAAPADEKMAREAAHALWQSATGNSPYVSMEERGRRLYPPD
jgi:hypothetical protein